MCEGRSARAHRPVPRECVDASHKGPHSTSSTLACKAQRYVPSRACQKALLRRRTNQGAARVRSRLSQRVTENWAARGESLEGHFPRLGQRSMLGLQAALHEFAHLQYGHEAWTQDAASPIVDAVMATQRVRQAMSPSRLLTASLLQAPQRLSFLTQLLCSRRLDRLRYSIDAC